VPALALAPAADGRRDRRPRLARGDAARRGVHPVRPQVVGVDLEPRADRRLRPDPARRATRRARRRGGPHPPDNCLLETNFFAVVQSYIAKQPRNAKERDMKKLLVALGAVVASLAVALPGALGSRAADPGITSKLVTIGGTFP